MISNYDLGIIWSLGSIVEKQFVIRHKEKYFVDRVANCFGGNVYSQYVNNDIQYVLKTNIDNVKIIFTLGRNNRNSNKRTLPILDNYKDFLRAYLEIHSVLDYSKRKVKNPYKALRIKVYGNKILIDEISKILATETFVGLKTPQICKNSKTAVLYYQSLKEIQMIFDYVYGIPCFEKLWDEIDKKMREPVIYL